MRRPLLKSCKCLPPGLGQRGGFQVAVPRSVFLVRAVVRVALSARSTMCHKRGVPQGLRMAQASSVASGLRVEFAFSPLTQDREV